MSGRAPLPSLAISFDLSKSNCCARRSDHPACSAPNVRLRCQSTDRQLELAQKKLRGGQSRIGMTGACLVVEVREQQGQVWRRVSVSAKFKLDPPQYATSPLDALLSRQTVLSSPLERSINEQAEGRHQLLLTSRLSAFRLTPIRPTSLVAPSSLLPLTSEHLPPSPKTAYLIRLQGTLMTGRSSQLDLS